MNNAVYQNSFVENSVQAQTSGNKEVWADSLGTHGNYWSDYSTKYPNATQIGLSGIENATYSIDSNNQDNNPLMTAAVSETTVPEMSTCAIVAILISGLRTVVALVFRKRSRVTSNS